MKQYLGIRLRAELSSCDLELATQLEVVVDLAVEYEVIAAAGVGKGLMAIGRNVDDRETKVCERGDRVNVRAAVVRTPVGDGVSHPLDIAGIKPTVEIDNSCNSAHD